MEERVIEIERLSKNYGAIEAVKDVSLSVQKGEIFGLIGPNGAGKTTLFRMLLGLTRPTAGRIRIKGHDASEVWKREVRTHTGYLPENIAFYEHMSGLETLQFYATIKGVSEEEVRHILEKVDLSDAAKRKVGEYSRGMRQRLGLAQALLASPDILFLDEPTTGLDPEGIGAFYSIIREAKYAGATIILTSHILKEVQHRVDRLAIMGSGRVVASGTIRELRDNLALRSKVHVTLKGNGERLKKGVAFAGGECVHVRENRLTFDYKESDKLSVLKAVMSSEEEVMDIEIVEPSLEDVFMEYVCRIED